MSGTRDAAGRIAGTEFSLTQGDARRGTHPSVMLDGTGRGIVIYTGTADEKLYYVDGLFDRAGQLVGQEHLLDMSLPIP